MTREKIGSTASQQITTSLEHMGARPWRSSQIDPKHSLVITSTEEGEFLTVNGMYRQVKPSGVTNRLASISTDTLEGSGIATVTDEADLPKWKKWLTDNGFPEQT